jgi:mRNA interferase MazF
LGDRTGLGGAMKRGEVRWYKFSRPDKNRPVVILTRDSALEFLEEVTIAPITSTIRDIPTEVLLTKEDGMPRDCAVNLDHIQTVSKGKIGPLVTTLNSIKMSELRSALLFALGF